MGLSVGVSLGTEEGEESQEHRDSVTGNIDQKGKVRVTGTESKKVRKERRVTC